MALAADLIDNIVPISMFSRGGAAKAFAKATNSTPVIVVKNNEPIAVVNTPEEYAYLTEIEEDYLLLCEALTRLERAEDKPTYTFEEVNEMLGITQDDLDAIPDEEVEFE